MMKFMPMTHNSNTFLTGFKAFLFSKDPTQIDDTHSRTYYDVDIYENKALALPTSAVL